ncbi:hypothetical protein NDU88_003056 [Pleurodeles waltl]|uniref:Uncharacterized protein n=1 Tax=Pleurodeles waltl TaxID=8319 RepID=A0AAV7MCU1_PLEWA|nr:hypothetical protein NDU88_003056 [Pleurodeles waltl]
MGSPTPRRKQNPIDMGQGRLPTPAQMNMNQYTVTTPAADNKAGVAGSLIASSSQELDLTAILKMAIEPLACLLGCDPLISGWRWGTDLQDRVSLYAVDIHLFLGKPQRSRPRCPELLALYGEASALRLNLEKSLLVEVWGDVGGCVWCTDILVRRNAFKYLGIYLSPVPDLAWQLNFQPLCRALNRDHGHWRSLLLNILG